MNNKSVLAVVTTQTAVIIGLLYRSYPFVMAGKAQPAVPPRRSAPWYVDSCSPTFITLWPLVLPLTSPKAKIPPFPPDPYHRSSELNHHSLQPQHCLLP